MKSWASLTSTPSIHTRWIYNSLESEMKKKFKSRYKSSLLSSTYSIAPSRHGQWRVNLDRPLPFEMPGYPNPSFSTNPSAPQAPNSQTKQAQDLFDRTSEIRLQGIIWMWQKGRFKTGGFLFPRRVDSANRVLEQLTFTRLSFPKCLRLRLRRLRLRLRPPRQKRRSRRLISWGWCLCLWMLVSFCCGF